MINKEKFKEVFGFEPHYDSECLANDCLYCPCLDMSSNKICDGCGNNIAKWWNSEYKECEELINLQKVRGRK